jgi:glycosyltransferase involved in cell wall biosynthesis
MSRKRILILTKGLGRGGAELLLASSARYFDHDRYEYDVAFLLPWKNALVGELERCGMRVSCLDGARGCQWVSRLGALMQRRSYDLVHAHSPVPAIGARLASGASGPSGASGASGRLGRRAVPMVYTEHGLWGRYRRPTYWANLLTFSRNQHVFAVSEQVRRSIRYPGGLRRLLPMPPLETLYQGIDASQVEHWQRSDGVRAELGIAEDALVVGVVANLRALKGHRYLLQAAVRIRAEVPGVRFLLVGHGPAEQELRRLTSDLGLDETVVFAGYREDAPRMTSACDVFVLPSLYEGLSIALLEAMALGKPAVATRVGGLPEVIGSGQGGLLVPPGDDRALADALLTLLGDPALRRQLGEVARRRSVAFDIRDTVARTEELYGELIV